MNQQNVEEEGMNDENSGSNPVIIQPEQGKLNMLKAYIFRPSRAALIFYFGDVFFWSSNSCFQTSTTLKR